jgi:hypothetical protein
MSEVWSYNKKVDGWIESNVGVFEAFKRSRLGLIQAILL